MEIFTKKVSYTDITGRFQVPVQALKHLTFPEGCNYVDLLVMDSKGKRWIFRCYKRWEGHPKPALSTIGWSEFVEAKHLEVDDKIIFHKLKDEAAGVPFGIEVKRLTCIKLFNQYICDWVHVE